MEKQKYKIIFIDIDGTLVNDEKQVTQRTINTIKKLKEKGIITVLTSGRPYGSIDCFFLLFLVFLILFVFQDFL